MNEVNFMAQPLLSIGMIVKNEERCLEKCLKALEPLRQAIPCELVIADTGSTDKTKEIAKKYADILFDFTWINDFSAARNTVMNKATGKWFLTLDADEYLTDNIDELVAFLTGPTAQTRVIASIVVRNYFSASMDSNYSDSHLVRLVRMDTNRRYSGRIHESLPYTTEEEIYTLTQTIFDHDGYAPISAEFSKNKEERNLNLLEEELKKDPDNIRTISQCLDAAAQNDYKRAYYTDYAFKKMQTTSKNNIAWSTYGPACMRQILVYASHDQHSNVSEMFEFAFKNFPDSECILLDTNYIYIKHLIKNKDYKNAIKAGKVYSATFEKKEKTKTIDFFSNLLYAAYSHKQEMLILTALAMIEENRESEAIKYLMNVDLREQQKSTPVKNWVATALKIKDKKAAAKLIGEKLSKILEGHKNGDEGFSATYYKMIPIINSAFPLNPEDEVYRQFSEVSESLSLQVKIIESNNSEEIQNYINEFDTNENLKFDEFTPLAFKKLSLSDVNLPDKFYLTSQENLSYLIAEISKTDPENKKQLINNYCNIDTLKDFPRVIFAFNLLTNMLFTGIGDNEITKLALNKYNEIANTFLSQCYSNIILENENNVFCLPITHTFAWYLLKANKLKNENPLEYVKTLRTALQKVPQAKEIIEFLIEDLQAQEEKKKQEQIKNAAPELVAMAEQLKVMLSAFPENSPELLAIKQSPMYKQVAFLIED